MRVFVVWEPVIRTDIAPPTDEVMASLPDSRVAQYWDPGRLLSTELIRVAKANPDRLPADFEIPEIIWDVVLVFEPGAVWGDTPPFPAYFGGPVVDVKPALREAITR